MPAYTKVDSSWKNNKIFIKTGNSSWSYSPQVYVKTSSNKWTPLYSYEWETGGWSGCSPYCSGTQTRTVKCKNKTLNIYEDSKVCEKLLGSTPATSQECNNPCSLTLTWHWDDESVVSIKRRSDNTWVDYGSVSDNKWGTISLNPPSTDWPLRMRFYGGNSGGHGCGCSGAVLTIPGAPDVQLIYPNWSNSGGCWGYMYVLVNSDGTVERKTCDFGAERCSNAGYPNVAGEPSW